MRTHRTSIIIVAALLFIFGMLAVPSTQAQPKKGVALQLGLGINPDQFVAGLQTDWGAVAQSVVRFVPSAHVGFGDDIIGVDINGDFQVPVFRPANSRSVVYVSAGPTIYIWDPDHGDGDTEIGASLNGGITRVQIGETVFTNFEMRLGLGDVPDVRFLIGIGI